ncbi:MAG TPA: response regulator [Allosphingosinicella sp.]
MATNLVHVVDDDDAVRSSLTLMMNTEGLPSIGWPSADTFLAAANLHSGGCALVDLYMPGISGLQLQDELNKRGSNLGVVMLTGHGDVGSAVTALKKGAFDFIEKPFDDEDLIGRVKAAMEQHERVHMSRSDAVSRIAKLSPREKQVLTLLADGKLSKEIAFELGLSLRTVEMHRTHISDRLGVRRASEAIKLAIQAQLTN